MDINDFVNSSLTLEDVVELNENLYPFYQFYYEINQVRNEVVKTLKTVLRKSVVTADDIPKILQNHFVVDNNNLGNKRSNYTRIEDDIYSG